MLDTNTLIYFIKNKPPSVAERINALNEDDVLCMSFVTYAELLKGALRSTRKEDVLRRLGGVVQQIPAVFPRGPGTVSYTHLRAHETVLDLVCRLLLEKKHLYLLIWSG